MCLLVLQHRGVPLLLEGGEVGELGDAATGRDAAAKRWCSVRAWRGCAPGTRRGCGRARPAPGSAAVSTNRCSVLLFQ